MIELFAITRAQAPPPPPPLRVLVAGGLGAVVGPVEEQEEVSAEALWHHEQVVEALMADRDVLPARYGTRFEHDEDAAQAVAARRATLGAALDRVHGAVELSVRAVRAEPVQTHIALVALARDAKAHEPQSPDEVLRAAYLVDRDAVGAFTARVAELQAAQPDAQILCTGPWPPYSFSEP